jgi:RHS repeat-associated protein
MTDASGKSYTWDFENRLTQAVVPGTNGGTTTFKYDPFGRRIQKSGPLGTTNYLYDGKNTDAAALEELDISGNVLARYAQSPDVDEPLAELRSGVTSYYQQDALNSVTSLSGGTGALASTYTYDAFGNLTASSGTRTNPYRFTAREFDPETGIYEYRHRYYDSSVGRFISEDPIGLNGGANFYRYVLNNPVKWTDAMGLSPRDVKRIQAACHKCTKNLLTDPGLRADVNTDLGGEWNDLTSWFTKRLGCWSQAIEVKPCLEPNPQPYDDTWTFNVVYWPINNHVVRGSSSNPNDPDVICDPWENQTWTSSKPRGR